jgi:hypothetical protein
MKARANFLSPDRRGGDVGGAPLSFLRRLIAPAGDWDQEIERTRIVVLIAPNLRHARRR